MDKQDLLLEIGCEELPTQAVKSLSSQFADRFMAQLTLCGLTGERETINGFLMSSGSPQPEIFATPRRIAIRVLSVSTQLAPQFIERQGPSCQQAFDVNGKPTPAALGFAKSCGVDIADIEQKNNRLYFKTEKPGQNTIDILPELAHQTIKNILIPKPMRWGTHPESFARPVHWILFLFGADLVKVSLFGIDSGRQTDGHRFHHPGPLTIDTPRDYARILKDQGHVIADFNERKEKIREQIRQLSLEKQGLTVDVDENLLDEATALVEWPVALIGHFNPEFLTVPQEALITSMKTNQKYFPVLNAQGQLQPAFVLISNIEGKDPELIIHGNERVLNARLSDAAFFFKNDCAHSLQSRLPQLEQVTFQKQLGSLADKTARMMTLAVAIAEMLGEDPQVVKDSAQLSKCDLLSEMVGEFPTLQGIMGYHYAKNDKLSENCAVAIKEHYLPRFSGDQLPKTMAGNILALADRLDTLIGIFGINQLPTGNKDPFALRRAALGVLHILIDKKLDLDLEELLKQAKHAYAIHLPNQEADVQVLAFIIDRLHPWYVEQGVSSEQVNAVLHAQPPTTKPLDFAQRVEAVRDFQKLPEATALAAAHKRVKNILKNTPTIALIDPSLFENESEQRLAQCLETQTKVVNALCQEKKYTEALNQLAELKEPVDAFFDTVMVMVDNKAQRDNRLALLAGLYHLLTQIADISLL